MPPKGKHPITKHPDITSAALHRLKKTPKLREIGPDTYLHEGRPVKMVVHTNVGVMPATAKEMSGRARWLGRDKEGHVYVYTAPHLMSPDRHRIPVERVMTAEEFRAHVGE